MEGDEAVAIAPQPPVQAPAPVNDRPPPVFGACGQQAFLPCIRRQHCIVPCEAEASTGVTICQAKSRAMNELTTLRQNPLSKRLLIQARE